METFKATDVHIGYHQDGFRIDKTTSPMNRYTQWDISPEGKWSNPKPVCFHSLPASGWNKIESFDWTISMGRLCKNINTGPAHPEKKEE